MNPPFEVLLEKPDARTPKWRRLMLRISLAAHGMALIGGVAHSLWQVDEMHPPSLSVRARLTTAPPPSQPRTRCTYGSRAHRDKAVINPWANEGPQVGRIELPSGVDDALQGLLRERHD